MTPTTSALAPLSPWNPDAGLRDVENLVLCATNEGGHYRTWLRLARDGGSDADWLLVLAGYALGLVRAGRADPGATSAPVLCAAAAQLRAYYLDHLAESAAIDQDRPQ